MAWKLSVAGGKMITSQYSLRRRRSEYRLVLTKPEETNCFSKISTCLHIKINTT